MNKVRIVWKSRLTGHAGHGEPVDENSAKAWLSQLNHLEIDHWFEPVPQRTDPEGTQP